MSDDIMAAILDAARLLDQHEREQMEFYSYSLMPPAMCWRDASGKTTRFIAHADTWKAAIDRVAPMVERPPFVALTAVWGVPIKNLDKDDKARREVMGGLFERAAERAGLAGLGGAA